MKASINIRKAIKPDAGDLAILDDIASHGLANWLWYGAVITGHCDAALERGRERMAESSPFGYINAHVAENDGDIAGAIIDYPMIFEGPPSSLGPIADPVLKTSMELMKTIHGHWYVDSLAVFKPNRGKGVARALLNVAKDRARIHQKSTISLITQDDNLAAISLYQSSGFKIVDRRDFVPFNKTSKTKEWLLLSAPVN